MSNNNYSLISVIDSEQIMRLGYPSLTSFSLMMSRNLKSSNFELENYYLYKDNPFKNKEYDEDYLLLKSNLNTAEDGEKVCLSVKNMDKNLDTHEIINCQNCYKERYVGQQFGIVPSIPYNYVCDIATKVGSSYYKNVFNSKKPDNRLSRNEGICYDNYILGYYPKSIIDFEYKYARWDHDVYPNIYIPSKNFTENSFIKTEEKITLPSILDDKLIIEDYNVYCAIDNNEEIRAIKYNDEWFCIEPVQWIKIGDNLVCEDVLFESPIHMKNEYVKNDNIESLDETFLKWYIDNIFTRDLFKYTDLSSIKKQISLAIDEDIDTKLKEIERLKQLKANLILQQQSEHIIDTAHRNITRLFEEDTKEQVFKALHK